jgi:HD superfamily phosphohydrolase
VDKEFLDALREKYAGLKNGEQRWDEENPVLQKILCELGEAIAPRYKLLSPIGVGGAGVIIKVYDTNLEVEQALKVARPVEGKYSLMAEIIAGEISHLRSSAHPNIIDIFYHDRVAVDGTAWPYYIMEYVAGACDALEYLSERNATAAQMVSVVRQCAEGMSYLHTRGAVHLDVKLENILVSPSGRAVLADLGSARTLRADTGTTQITFSRPWAHPGLLGIAVTTSHPESVLVRGEMPRNRLRKEFDLYALGKNIFRLLGFVDRADTRRLNPYVRAYLELMAARLLDGKNTDDECALGLPRGAVAELRYISVDEVILDLKKLSGEYAIHAAIPELDHHYPRRLQICGNVSMALPRRLANLVSHPILRRLASISQLGLIVQIYPTATHSRLEHVLGTLANVARYCDALWNDPINPLFRQIMSDTDIKAVLLAALCHDLGQYPMAHDLEEADKETFAHQELTERILKGDVEGMQCAQFHRILRDDWQVTPEQVLGVIQAKATDDTQPLKARLLHTLIDGPMDADKIDYLVRDSNNLNVPYGQAIDVERLLRCLTVVFKAEGTRTLIALGIHEKGKIPAEAIAFARYAMFGAVYWHHTSRAAKAMLHRAAWEAIREAIATGDRRSGAYKVFRKAFQQQALHIGEAAGGELPFPKDGIVASPQMAISDYNMLRWLYDRTSSNGKKLLELLCNRELFKRLAVVSPKGNLDLWKTLCRFQQEGGWDGMLNLQRDLQRRLVELLRDLPAAERSITTLLSEDVTDAIIARDNEGEILFLVDLPPDRPGAVADLRFLSESRTNTGALLTGTLATETSILSSDIAGSFRDSVGKARVFCHPAVADTALLALRKSQVEAAVEAACRHCRA